MIQDKPLAQTYIVCGVVIRKSDKYLLVQEKQPKVYGLWNLPAGKVDAGETLEQAAIREAKEETGFDVVLREELLTYHPAVDKPVLHSYAGDITGGELHVPADELLDVQWFTYKEIMAMGPKIRAPEYVLPSIELAEKRAQ